LVTTDQLQFLLLEDVLWQLHCGLFRNLLLRHLV
jgi:hypothetical protein